MAKKNQLEIIDEQIKKKQDKMFVLKGQIDTLADEVKELLKQKEEVKKEGLMEAIEESGRTYDEILDFLKTVPKRTSAQPREKRKYKPRKPKNVD